MAPALRRHADSELARRVSAGDVAAFATLDDRHRRALTRYAGTLLRRSEHDAEDVVQDVLIRAHDALRAGDVPDELRPWLYRLTRNRAIDEVRRKRWSDEALDSETIGTTAGDRGDPDAVLSRKESMRRLVDDLADLPVRQRTALLARELDGQTPEQVATQLGVSVAAAQKLATRARENLLRTREAREADCPDVRASLLESHERGLRPTEQAVRHLKGCDGCRAHRRDIRRLSRQLHGLNPAFGLPLFAGVVKVFGGGGAKAAAGTAAAVAVVATGGLIVLRSDVHEAGDPAPFRLAGIRDEQGRPVKPGAAVPGRTAVVTVLVQLPPESEKTGVPPSTTLNCPTGLRFIGYVEPERRRAFYWQPSREAIPGYSTSVTIPVAWRAPGGADKGTLGAAKGTIGIVCRRPDANGSTADNPRKLQPGERLAHVCVDRATLWVTPGRGHRSDVYRGEPVAIQRRNASGRWTLVGHDPGLVAVAARPGWIRTGYLCP